MPEDLLPPGPGEDEAEELIEELEVHAIPIAQDSVEAAHGLTGCRTAGCVP
ncbi:hypothetical protein [Nonomuraea sp. NPDC048826]|uniref:hypothetical protein n=1 Tax=Nonomuraea sp. NPDC048826 TaxID=3364347 RepID=UPI003710877A